MLRAKTLTLKFNLVYLNMQYNVVHITNSWNQTGLLDEYTSVKLRVELARTLHKCVNILNKMDDEDDLPETDVIGLCISSVIEIFDSMYIRVFSKNEVTLQLLSGKLKHVEHKIDVRGLIELVIDKVEEYPEDSFSSDYGSYDVEIVKTVSDAYLIKYGTLV